MYFNASGRVWKEKKKVIQLLSSKKKNALHIFICRSLGGDTFHVVFLVIHDAIDVVILHTDWRSSLDLELVLVQIFLLDLRWV